jgi:hypothetical protein
MQLIPWLCSFYDEAPVILRLRFAVGDGVSCAGRYLLGKRKCLT